MAIPPINTNIPSLSAQNSLNRTQHAQNKTLETLSSGKRVNSAADDPAASAIVELFAAQITGSNQAVSNLSAGISAVEVADGATQQLQDNTNRIRELAVQAGNDTLSAQDRQALQAEANQLAQSNQDIVRNTNFNGTQLLQGGASLGIQSGPNANDVTNVNAANLNAAPGSGGLNTLAGGVDLSSSAAVAQTLTNLDQDISTLSNARAQFGAANARFESSISNLQTRSTNLAEAKSRIGDTDFGAATSKLAQEQIRSKAGLAVLTQANASPQQVLSLLQR